MSEAQGNLKATEKLLSQHPEAVGDVRWKLSLMDPLNVSLYDFVKVFTFRKVPTRMVSG